MAISIDGQQETGGETQICLNSEDLTINCL